ncbi:hypothetical protein LCGC14_1655390 [marine sediment metagenome]|uniref:Uncharacterized protein n=1 Tax=marine sediment metagenome TaxID=412755 RepID=A0A0F9II57_9ZZZZ
MENAIKLSIEVVARMGCRKVSYNVKDMERALLQVGLTPVRNTYDGNRVGALFTAEQVYSNKADTIAARKRIEGAIKRVHRNAAYIFKFEEVQNDYV